MRNSNAGVGEVLCWSNFIPVESFKKGRATVSFCTTENKNALINWLQQLFRFIVNPMASESRNIPQYSYTITVYFLVLDRLLQYGCPTRLISTALDKSINHANAGNHGLPKAVFMEFITHLAVWLPQD